MINRQFCTSTIHSAIQNLRSAPLRTCLSLVGIVVSCAVIVAMLHIGLMTQRKILSQLQQVGLELAVVNPARSALTGFITDDLEKTKKIENQLSAMPGISNATVWTNYFEVARVGNLEYPLVIVEATSNITQLSGLTTSGNSVNLLNKIGTPVVFVPSLLQGDLGETLEVDIDSIVWLGIDGYRVVGKYELSSYNPLLDLNPEHTVLVPRGSLARTVDYANVEWRVILEIDQGRQANFSPASVVDFFHEQYSVQVNVIQAENLIQAEQAQTRTLSLIMVSLGGISLFVGLVGIANIMLASVAERRMEIGLRMAIGASPKAIMSLFIVESIVLCAFGGVIGVLLGLAVTVIYANIVASDFFVSASVVALAFIVSVCGGVISGFFPARRSSQLDPVLALQ